MGRFRCPSSSLSTVSSSPQADPRLARHIADMTLRPEAQAGPSLPAATAARPPSKKPGKDKGKGKMRATSPDPTTQRERVRMAAKRDKVKRQAGLKPGLWSFIFVGNLDPSITEPMIRKAFKSCGTIARIQLRMGAGHYASVEFYEQGAPKKAVDTLDGTMLGGVKMVVCYSAADLPEVKATLRHHKAKMQGKTPMAVTKPQPKPTLGKYVQAIKRLIVDRTVVASEMLDLGHDANESTSDLQAGPSRIPAPKSKHRLLGVSFPKTLI
ncbi:hypothetical protein OBBRIDRAFT_823551 [Obba rivulosa]|uniref:RRM domain-containing protein n=1 Tax=Obba rivulosa TaxID=1052685 RepID=A0A8E2DR30_9APHY|nr:hypothetical protein OBBRIDRAFT_823551 [Obba rivulosa]